MNTPAADHSPERIQKLLGFLAVDPGNLTLRITIADLQHASGDFAAAEESFRAVLEMQPDHAIARSRMASVYLSQHRFDEAEAVLRGLDVQVQQVPAISHNMGLALVYQQRWPEALAALETAAAGGLDDAENLMYQAYCLHHLGRTEEALAKATASLERAPDDRVQGYVSLLQMDAGDIKIASRTAARVLERDPHNIDANTVRGWWGLETQEIEDAEECIERVLAQRPDDPRSLLGKGLVQLYKQQTPEAVETLQRAVAGMPQSPGAWVTLGWAQIAQGDLPGAEKTFRDALELERSFGETHGGLASVLALAGRAEEARESIRKARGLNKEGFGVVFAMTVLMANAGKQEAATKLFGNMLLRSPGGTGGMTLIQAVQIFSRRQGRRGGTVPALPRRK